MKRKISKETYDNVIKLIPNKILEMLPESPEHLLKYAERVKQINFSKNIPEDVKVLMEKHLLSDEEYLKTFYYVMAITFYNKKPVENPEIAVVAAQTGSGKSNLTAKLLRKDPNFIFIDSDKYKHFRFDAQDIAKNHQVLYPYLTGPDGYDHASNIYNYAVDKKYNIIKETAPLANKSLVELNTEDLNKKNYKISIHILATGILNSSLSLHERYELQIIHGLKTAKLTGLSRHDESYNSLIKNVEELLENDNINSINVYMRGAKENSFNPLLIYPSGKYNSPIKAIEEARKIDNDKTKKEFNLRYELLKHQMSNRTTPYEQQQQLDSLKTKYLGVN